MQSCKTSLTLGQRENAEDYDYIVSRTQIKTFQLNPKAPFQLSAIAPFRERHIIENLSFTASNKSKLVLYYNLLNQGRKRGK